MNAARSTNWNRFLKRPATRGFLDLGDTARPPQPENPTKSSCLSDANGQVRRGVGFLDRLSPTSIGSPDRTRCAGSARLRLSAPSESPEPATRGPDGEDRAGPVGRIGGPTPFLRLKTPQLAVGKSPQEGEPTSVSDRDSHLVGFPDRDIGRPAFAPTPSGGSENPTDLAESPRITSHARSPNRPGVRYMLTPPNGPERTINCRPCQLPLLIRPPSSPLLSGPISGAS
jgi:hypothetical protein